MTKEAHVPEFIQRQGAFKKAIGALQSPEVQEEILKLILKSPEQAEQAINNVASLLSRQGKPEVSEVLEAFNAGLGSDILHVEEGYVELSVDALQSILTNSAKTLSETLYPKDYFSQIITFGMFQTKIKDFSEKIRPITDDTKIPVETFEAVLSFHAISKRDVAGLQQRDLVSDLIASVETTICESLVSAVITQISTILDAVQEFLSSITVSSGSDVVSIFITSVVNILTQVVDYVDDLIQTYATNLCTDLSTSVSSRRRRDLALIEGDFERTKRDTTSLATKSILGDIGALIWSLFSPIMNTFLTSLAESFLYSIQDNIDYYITYVVVPYVDSIISSVFPSS